MMRNIFLFCVLMKRSLWTAFLVYPIFLSAQSGIDVTHYRFHIGLNENNDTLYGFAIINFIVKEKMAYGTLDLESVKKNGRGMKVLYVTTKENEPKPFKIVDDQLKFSIEGLKKGDSSTIIVNYNGLPSDGLIISKNKYGHRTFFGDNWPTRAHYWLPCHDDPADKASVEFVITAPEHYQAVANGIQISETDHGNGFKETHWREEIPISTKVMTIGVAEFTSAVVGNLNDCVPIYSWTYPEDSQKGIYDFAVTKDILQYYSKAIGAYAFKKLANVQSKTRFGGLENANTIFYKEDAVTGNRYNETLYAHEIAHQWFGNMATEKNFGHLWLSEGFATYMTICYFENKYGKDSATFMRRQDRDEVIAFAKVDNSPVVDEAETDYMQLLNPNSYQKGGWILHMLRTQLGDSIFWKAIRKYYADYAGKIAGTEDLQKVFETASGKDLKQFFKQWLYTPGIPKLDIKWSYDAKKKMIDIAVKQLQSTAFSFPLEIKYSKDNKIALKKVLNISSANESFSIPFDKKPISIIADPGVNLLFSGNISEVK